jgi:hypothetical protein
MSKVNGLRLLGVGNNAKTVKGDGSEYLTAIMYLAPADQVEGINMCPMAVLAGCKSGCLNTAGRGQMNCVQQARVRKTILWRDNPELFLEYLRADLKRFSAYCLRKAIKPCVRLNGTSDVPWELHIDMAVEFPEIQFYDYTKTSNRLNRTLPDNYSITLSYSEASDRYAGIVTSAAQKTGANLAVVWRSKDVIPKTFLGRTVVDGDKDDLRFLDPAGGVVALYAKGSAKHDTSGFVID